MKRQDELLMPQARKEGLIVRELSGEVLVYDRDRSKAHCLNSTAALVWQYCDGKTPVSQIARTIEGAINVPVDEEVVWLGVEQLKKSKLLKSTTVPSHVSGLSRRDVMKRIGLAAAVALPVVTSIIAPSAAQAANCLPSGQTCTSSAQGCSQVCSGGMCA